MRFGGSGPPAQPRCAEPRAAEPPGDAPAAVSEPRPALHDAVRAVLPYWILARLLTAAAVVLVRGPFSPGHGTSYVVYDAWWYRAIARVGYGGLPPEALRFFPGFPLVVRALHFALRVDDGLTALVVANVASLLAVALLWLLVVRDAVPGNRAVATRAGGLSLLGPAGFVLVLGYSESLAQLGTIAAFLAVRRARPSWAIPAGLVAGLTRPTGVLLAAPLAVEAARHWRTSTPRLRAGYLAAALAPLAGTAAYLTWVQANFGDWQLPLKAQQGVRRSYLSLPLGPLKHSVVAAVHLEDPVTVLHLPVVLLAVGLIVVGLRRLPVSYSLFAALTVGAALTAHTLDSLERYVSSAFPIWICAGLLLSQRRRAIPVYVLAAAWCLWYACLALLGRYTP